MNEHKSRFKAYLVPPRDLAVEAQEIRAQLNYINEIKEKITDAEKVLLFIFVYVQKRNPDQWYISRGRSPRPAQTQNQNLKFANLPESFAFLKKISSQNLEEFCDQYQFKKLPGSLVRTISDWHSGKIKLVLHDSPVTPLEMLSAQARGERIVTLDIGSALAGRTVDGSRDAFEFLLHDLIHADLFFGEGHSEQVAFFSNFHRVMVLEPQFSGFFAEAMLADSVFAADIHYLISDMNSHVEHMRALLSASLIKHRLFSSGKEPTEMLSAELRSELDQQITLLNTQIFP